MQHASSIMRAACLLLGLGAAQAMAQVAASAADPAATVPATVYKPAIGQRPDAEPDTTPDQHWVAGNATVAAYNSMSLTMKGMKGHAASAPAAAQAPAAAPADPHPGHGTHAGHGAAPVQPAPRHKESP